MTTPVTRWLELRMLGGDQWIVPIWAAAHAAEQPGRVPPLTDQMGQLGLYISVRLDMLPRIAERITEEASAVYEAAKGHGPQHVFTRTSQGYVLAVDDDLKFRLLADIDSLLFEISACWELMRKLYQLVRTHVGHPIDGGQGAVTLKLKVALAGVGDEWFAWLDRQRNFVAHEGTPYISIDVTSDGAWELLVTKEHPTTFADPKTFFRYSELVGVAKGFSGAMQALQAHLIALFNGVAPPAT